MDQWDDRQFYIYVKTWPAPSENRTGISNEELSKSLKSFYLALNWDLGTSYRNGVSQYLVSSDIKEMWCKSYKWQWYKNFNFYLRLENKMNLQTKHFHCRVSIFIVVFTMWMIIWYIVTLNILEESSW